jgi:hypothetical protein
VNNGRKDIIDERSKHRLKKEIKKKIQTTMIGSLSSIERYFGFLWGEDSEEELTKDQERMRDIFEDLRTEILDKGNIQIRNADAEIDSYDVSWNKYHINLPIRRY